MGLGGCINGSSVTLRRFSVTAAGSYVGDSAALDAHERRGTPHRETIVARPETWSRHGAVGNDPVLRADPVENTLVVASTRGDMSAAYAERGAEGDASRHDREPASSSSSGEASGVGGSVTPAPRAAPAPRERYVVFVPGKPARSEASSWVGSPESLWRSGPKGSVVPDGFGQWLPKPGWRLWVAIGLASLLVGVLLIARLTQRTDHGPSQESRTTTSDGDHSRQPNDSVYGSASVAPTTAPPEAVTVGEKLRSHMGKSPQRDRARGVGASGGSICRRHVCGAAPAL